MTNTDERLSLVLLSGLLCDKYVWEKVGELLSDIAAVSIFSFAGLNSLTAMAEKVLAESPDTFSLAGHSMGGRVAFEVYRQAPQRVERLALLNTGAHPRNEAEVPGRQRLLDLSINEGMSAVADTWLPPMMSEKARQDKVLMAALTRMILGHSPEDFAGQIHALLNRPDAKTMLPLIRVPTMLLSGSEDQWSPVSQHREIQAMIPGSELVSLEGVGHMSTVEAPESVAEAMRNWLTQSK